MIGKIIRIMRRENHLTQEELSKITFIGRSTLSDYEREKNDISFEDIEKIADACNYKVIFLNKEDNSKILSSENIERKESNFISLFFLFVH